MFTVAPARVGRFGLRSDFADSGRVGQVVLLNFPHTVQQLHSQPWHNNARLFGSRTLTRTSTM